ncbi:MAG: CoB--CoM heterodisulfide reductase iron-sulfur subunit B family protein [Candidatus Acidiferrum sp.]
MNIGYYPGCALHGSSNDYEQSLRACLGALNVQLGEIKDWICCGATAAHSLNHKLSLALPARNLAVAERDGFKQLFAPCPLCSMQLLKVKKAVADERVRKELSEIVEADVRGESEVLNLIQLFEKIGVDRLKSAVKAPLKSITAACYYGCLLTRPPDVVHFDDFEQPTSMETVLAALGAKTVEWSYKTECCGAGMTMSNENIVLELAHKILSNAAEHGANCLVVACPMCHVNLDMKQVAVERRFGKKLGMVVYYLSDLVGLALGLSAEQLGINRHFVTQA